MDLNILKNQNVKIILMIKKILVINVKQNIYKLKLYKHVNFIQIILLMKFQMLI